MYRATALELALATGGLAALVAWALSGIVARFAVRFGAVDQPSGGRKIHTHPIPLWGGVGIALTILAMLGACMTTGVFLRFGLNETQVIGYAAGVVILLLGGMIDDRHPLTARVQICFPILAAIAVILSGTGIVQVTNPTARGGLSLVWWQGYGMSLPSDLITFAWLLVATYAMKVLDGLDGLVAGLTVIGASLVGALSVSLAYFQPGVALLSGMVGGSFLGFLPRNANPAKQFLGESGSTIAGFSLGVLAILSSAKVAIALSVLAIPIADAVLVVAGRVRRGVPWYQGDDTHLHFRLLRAGVSHRVAVGLYWGVALLAGMFALSAQTRGKLFLVAFLVVLAALGSYVAGLKAARARNK